MSLIKLNYLSSVAGGGLIVVVVVAVVIAIVTASAVQSHQVQVHMPPLFGRNGKLLVSLCFGD